MIIDVIATARPDLLHVIAAHLCKTPARRDQGKPVVATGKD